MIGRVLEIATAVQLQKDYGRLKVSNKEGTLEIIPFDDIAGIIFYPTGGMASAAVISECARRGIPCLFLDEKYQPLASMVSHQSHFHQSKKLEQQIQLSEPMRKQAWKQIVVNKIQMQAAALKSLGVIEYKRLENLSADVLSGDTTNIEAQAASIYFPAIYHSSFIRDRQKDGANAMLNYGYTVMRSAMARALQISGLTLGLGLFHHNAYNPFRLADDLMESYRPLVDLRVLALTMGGHEEMTPEAKKHLVQLLRLQVEHPKGSSPASVYMRTTAQTLSKFYENQKENKIELISPKQITLFQAAKTLQ